MNLVVGCLGGFVFLCSGAVIWSRADEVGFARGQKQAELQCDGMLSDAAQSLSDLEVECGKKCESDLASRKELAALVSSCCMIDDGEEACKQPQCGPTLWKKLQVCQFERDGYIDLFDKCIAAAKEATE